LKFEAPVAGVTRTGMGSWEKERVEQVDACKLQAANEERCHFWRAAN
jgi:hypothetical protein